MSKRCREPPKHQCQPERPVQCCVGPRGATGVAGTPGATGVNGATGASGSQLPSGVNYSDYLFWNSNTKKWEVGSFEVHLGAGAGVSQGTESVAIGKDAGASGQGVYSVAIGSGAGASGQEPETVAIGSGAGHTDQSIYSVAIGSLAGYSDQKTNSIAIGYCAGKDGQGQEAAAVGSSAGAANQGNGAVALGRTAGASDQGAYAIAIGYAAGDNSQPPKSIIMNANDIALNSITPGLFIDPIRPITGPHTGPTGGVMWYNSHTKEVNWELNTKTFVINHPTAADRYLVHACLEGPESGVYYRGESELVERCVEIVLPNYVPELADNFTVQLTQIWRGPEETFARLSAGRVGEDGTFTVYGDPCAFAWHVYGTRKHIETEPLKSEVKVAGEGPYRYIQ